MKKSFLGAVALMLLAACPAFAAARDYSADMEMNSPSGAMAGKIYVSGQKLRYEMGPAVTLTRLDQGKSYVLMPEQKMYMENPIDPLAAAKAGVGEEGSMTVERLGAESFEGRNVEKTKTTYSDANGSVSMLQWLDADGLPVRVEAEDGSWSVVYRNKETGPQQASLFEVPADYQPLVMPDIGQMMKEMNVPE